MIIKDLLKKNPNIYLALFAIGMIVFGIEIGEVYHNGFSKEIFRAGLKAIGLLLNFSLSIYFFYCFVKTKNRTKQP